MLMFCLNMVDAEMLMFCLNLVDTDSRITFLKGVMLVNILHQQS